MKIPVIDYNDVITLITGDTLLFPRFIRVITPALRTRFILFCRRKGGVRGIAAPLRALRLCHPIPPRFHHRAPRYARRRTGRATTPDQVGGRLFPLQGKVKARASLNMRLYA